MAVEKYKILFRWSFYLFANLHAPVSRNIGKYS